MRGGWTGGDKGRAVMRVSQIGRWREGRAGSWDFCRVTSRLVGGWSVLVLRLKRQIRDKHLTLSAHLMVWDLLLQTADLFVHLWRLGCGLSLILVRGLDALSL